MAGPLQAALWLGVYLSLVLAPLVLLVVVETPRGGGFWWEMAIGLGFAALVMIAMQFLLTARFRRATAPFGIDIVYYFHRYLAFVLLALVVAHPAILMLVNPALAGYLNPLRTPWEINSGTASLMLLIVLVATSACRRALGIAYERWRMAHLALAVAAAGLALTHILAIGHYTAVPALRWLWLAIGGSLLAVVAWVRVVRPWRLKGEPYRVVSVVPDRGASWVLEVEPERSPGFSFEPGQFVWLTLRASPFAMREHPFSIASAPGSGRLAFAIKELGDFTRTLGTIQPGERCWVDAPYGSFSIDRHPDAPGYVFVAGGIGLAPMVGMLRALADRGDRRRHLLIAAHSAWDRVPLREAVAELGDRLDLRVVHVLEEPPVDWTGEVGLVTRDLLDRHLPADRAKLEYFVCGPVPFIRTVESALRDLGVPVSRVHTELFDLV